MTLRLIVSSLFVLVLFSTGASSVADGQVEGKGCSPVGPVARDPAFRLDPGSDHGFLKEKLCRKKSDGKVAIYALVPKNECEFRNVFRKSDGTPAIDPTKDDLAKLNKTQTTLSSSSSALPDQSRTAAGFAAFLSSAKEDIIAVVGDSEDGVFRFPDGSTATLISMAKQCSDRGKRCVFIAPVSRDPQSSDTGKVVFDEAVDLAQDLYYLHPPGSDGSLSGLIPRIQAVYPVDSSLSYSVNFILDSSSGKPQPVGVLIGFNQLRGAPESDHLPIALNRPRPNYTDKARNDKVQGIVRVRLLVDAHGVPETARVITGLPDGLTNEAVRAVFLLRFKPATKGGVHVAHWVVLEVEFNLGVGPVH